MEPPNGTQRAKIGLNLGRKAAPKLSAASGIADEERGERSLAATGSQFIESVDSGGAVVAPASAGGVPSKLVIPLPGAASETAAGSAIAASASRSSDLTGDLRASGGSGLGSDKLDAEAAAAVIAEYAGGRHGTAAVNSSDPMVIIAQPIAEDAIAVTGASAGVALHSAGGGKRLPGASASRASDPHAELRAKLFSATQKRVRGDPSAPPLLIQAALAGGGAGKGGGRDFRSDLASRPDDMDPSGLGSGGRPGAAAALEAYERIPVDAFGAAVLRGMGVAEDELEQSSGGAGRSAAFSGLLPGLLGAGSDGGNATSSASGAGAGAGAGASADGSGSAAPQRIKISGEHLGLGAASNPILMLQAYERMARRPRRPGDPPLPPPPPEIAALVAASRSGGSSGASSALSGLMSGMMGGNSASSASAPRGGASNGAGGSGSVVIAGVHLTKSLQLRLAKHPGLMDGAVGRIVAGGSDAGPGAGSGPAAVDDKCAATGQPLMVLLQSQNVPGLDRCRIQLLEPGRAPAGAVIVDRGTSSMAHGSAAGDACATASPDGSEILVAGAILTVSKNACSMLRAQLDKGAAIIATDEHLRSTAAAAAPAATPAGKSAAPAAPTAAALSAAVASVDSARFTLGLPADGPPVKLTAAQTAAVVAARLRVLASEAVVQVQMVAGQNLTPAPGAAASSASAGAAPTAAASESGSTASASSAALGDADANNLPALLAAGASVARPPAISRADREAAAAAIAAALEGAAAAEDAADHRPSDRHRDDDRERRRDRSHDRSHDRSRDRDRDRRRDGRKERSRSRSRSGERDRDRACDRDRERDRDRDQDRDGARRKGSRRSRSRSRSRDRDRRWDADGRRDRDRDRDRDRRSRSRSRSRDRRRRDEERSDRGDHRSIDDRRGDERDRRSDRDRNRASEQTAVAPPAAAAKASAAAAAPASRPLSPSVASSSSLSSSSGAPSSGSWLMPGIAVRIVDETGRFSRLFRSRATVVDVPSLGMATIKLDADAGATGGAHGSGGASAAFAAAASGRLVEGVPASALQTALPKPGGSAVIVAGPFRGCAGVLRERRAAEGVALVELRSITGAAAAAAASSRVQIGSVVRVPLDDAAERVGGMDEDEL